MNFHTIFRRGWSFANHTGFVGMSAADRAFRTVVPRTLTLLVFAFIYLWVLAANDLVGLTIATGYIATIAGIIFYLYPPFLFAALGLGVLTHGVRPSDIRDGTVTGLFVYYRLMLGVVFYIALASWGIWVLPLEKTVVAFPAFGFILLLMQVALLRWDVKGTWLAPIVFFATATHAVVFVVGLIFFDPEKEAEAKVEEAATIEMAAAEKRRIDIMTPVGNAKLGVPVYHPRYGEVAGRLPIGTGLTTFGIQGPVVAVPKSGECLGIVLEGAERVITKTPDGMNILYVTFVPSPGVKIGVVNLRSKPRGRDDCRSEP